MEDLLKKLQEMFAVYHVPAHDFKHLVRTATLAKKIARGEGYDEQEAEMAGLLHDVGRSVKNPTQPHGPEGVPIARELLNSYTSFDDEAKERILLAIDVHSHLKTEGILNHIVQDADKLDGMGAIGINRAYISHHHLPDYDPANIFPENPQYGKFKTAHELIVLEVQWYHMLYTETARKIGKPRYEFMQTFLAEFKREINESTTT